LRPLNGPSQDGVGGPISSAANSEASTPDGVDTDTTIILGDLIETHSERAGEVRSSEFVAPIRYGKCSIPWLVSNAAQKFVKSG